MDLKHMEDTIIENTVICHIKLNPWGLILL